MSDITPVWTAGTTPLRAWVSRPGHTFATTGNIDLRTEHGAYVFIRVGKGGTTTISPTGVDIKIRRLFTDGSANTLNHPTPHVLLKTSTSGAGASSRLSAYTGGANPTITVGSGTNFNSGDIISICTSTADCSNIEFFQVLYKSGSTLYIDKPFINSHTTGDGNSTGDIVLNKAEVFAPVWIPGGAYYDFMVDYRTQTTGDSIAVEILLQIYDKITAT